MNEFNLNFYKGKKVLVTGHTGFKGTWLCRILQELGAEVTGYSQKPPTDPSIFMLTDLESQIHSVIGDIRDLEHMIQVFKETQPEIVFHLAAQPIVRESYKNPVNTYETNVMGTVNVLEAVRQCGSVRSFLNVTTDKVYKNNEWEWGYRETDELDGYDPYSNSKSCSELVTHSYEKSFLKDMDIAVSTARAGNVIGFCSRPYHSGLCACCFRWKKDCSSESTFYQTISACTGTIGRVSSDRGRTVSGQPEGRIL